MDKGDCPTLQSPGWVGALLAMCMATITWGCQVVTCPPPDRGCLWRPHLQSLVLLLTRHAGGMASCPDTVVMGCEFLNGTFYSFHSSHLCCSPHCGAWHGGALYSAEAVVWWPVRHSLGIPWPMRSLTRPARYQACLGNLINPSPFWLNTT